MVEAGRAGMRRASVRGPALFSHPHTALGGTPPRTQAVLAGAVIGAAASWAAGRRAARASPPAPTPDASATIFRPPSASRKATEAALDAERRARAAAEADARSARADLAGLSAQLEASNRTRRAVAAELSSAFGLGLAGTPGPAGGRVSLFGGAAARAPAT